MKNPMHEMQLVLFDLDGTLVDSAPDIAAAVNIVLAEAGHAPLAVATVRSMIGHGVKRLVERAFIASGDPLDPDALDARTDRMMAVYGADLTSGTILMPGAQEAMSALVSHGIRIGTVTNKPTAMAHAILAHFGMADGMAVIIGGDSGVPRKPAPDMLHLALSRTATSDEACLFVGDGTADIEAAKAAGITCILVEGGYCDVPLASLGADGVIETLADLPAKLMVSAAA